MVRVLIVDDSSFMRRSLEAILSKSPDIEVVGTAANGLEAIAKVKELDPDVVTMDIEMPKMDGVTALQHIMDESPVPVIMISSLTTEGAEITLRAMDIGAQDYVPKANSSSLPVMADFEQDLIDKVKVLARRKSILKIMYRHKARERQRANDMASRQPYGGSGIGKTGGTGGASIPAADPARPQQKPLGKPWSPSQASTASENFRGSSTMRPSAGSNTTADSGQNSSLSLLARIGKRSVDIVAIGVSTGGPPAVQKVLSALPENFPVPIVIAQHMPASFTGPFANRLNTLCVLSVKEAEKEERLLPGWVYVCPGGKHLRVEKKGGILFGRVTEDPKEALYKPSANVLMETVGLALGRRALGLILTGMGNDGADGARVLKEKGGTMLAQSEESCVVYGMPKAIVDGNLADAVIDIDDISAALVRYCC